VIRVNAWWRRCALVTLMVFGLSTAIPAQNVHGGHLSVGWLNDLLRVRWASAQSPIGGLPKQLQGERPQHGGYVGAAAPASSGGAGRARG
jgi:hypothetical protein